MNSFRIINEHVRANALRAVQGANVGDVVTIKQPTRSTVANAKMWAMLGDIAKARPEGRQWTTDTWKAAFLHALGHQVLFAEGLDGSGPFPLGFRSSALNVKQMSDLIETMYAYGSTHGVVWSETERGGFIDLEARTK